MNFIYESEHTALLNMFLKMFVFVSTSQFQIVFVLFLQFFVMYKVCVVLLNNIT